MFFNDAAEITNKINAVLTKNPNNSVYITKSLEQNLVKLEEKLKDFQSIFEYYLTSTNSFARNQTSQ